MKNNNSGVVTAGAVILYGFLALGAWTAFILVSPKSTQEKIFAKFTHKPADAVDAAKKEEVKAVAVVDTHKDEVVHQAAIEADKAVKAAAQLPPSKVAEVTQRMAGNADSLLRQVSPLTATESQNNMAIVLGLLAEEQAARIAAENKTVQTQAQLDAVAAQKAVAEAKQAEAEKALAAKSDALVLAQTAAKEASAKVDEKEGQLRTAFDKENALANDYRVLILHRWALGIGAFLLLAGFLWLRFEMRGVGKSLPNIEKSLNPTQFHDFISKLDEKLSPVGQYLVRKGKAAEVAAQSEAGSLASGLAALAKPAQAAVVVPAPSSITLQTASPATAIPSTPA